MQRRRKDRAICKLTKLKISRVAIHPNPRLGLSLKFKKRNYVINQLSINKLDANSKAKISRKSLRICSWMRSSRAHHRIPYLLAHPSKKKWINKSMIFKKLTKIRHSKNKPSMLEIKQKITRWIRRNMAMQKIVRLIGKMAVMPPCQEATSNQVIRCRFTRCTTPRPSSRRRAWRCLRRNLLAKLSRCESKTSSNRLSSTIPNVI